MEAVPEDSGRFPSGAGGGGGVLVGGLTGFCELWGGPHKGLLFKRFQKLLGWIMMRNLPVSLWLRSSSWN